MKSSYAVRTSCAVWLSLAVAAPCLLVGCRPAEEIRTYRIAKPTESAAPEKAEAPPRPARPAEPTDRMLGSILPSSDRAWFFKAVGPRDQIDPIADSIKEFLGSVRFKEGKPTWELPEGWTEKPSGGMRLATLTIPASGSEKGIEMSVIGLSLLEDWDAQVLDNVNRWLKQLERSPLTADTISDEITPLADVAEGAVLIDQTGWFESGGMTPPFAGRSLGAPAPQPTAPPVSRPPASDLQDEKPEAWSAGKVSAMRKASYAVPGGAEVTAFAFPAAGQMGDELENANRWRGEVKLPPLTAEQLPEATEEMQLLGEAGSYFEFEGEEETTYVAMVVRGQKVWFFKLRGPGPAVAAQRDAFRGWLESLSL